MIYYDIPRLQHKHIFIAGEIIVYSYYKTSFQALGSS